MTNKTVEQMVGQKIRDKREALGWTQEDLGRLLGDYLEKPWSRQAIYEAEKGMRQFRAVELVALAEVLGLSMGSLATSPGEPIELPSGKVLDSLPARPVSGLQDRVHLLEDTIVRVDDLVGLMLESQRKTIEALVEMRQVIQLGLVEGEEGDS